ncbi:hypothetical protein BDW22DRAFT_1412656 [Trametopsis cervina]|nr:hypothetical protein BDW22DRAFT_1412656 [Trametopsis cervina]
MAITSAQKADIEAVIQALTEATGARKKRKLADMFLALPDADSWAQYYEVIPNPRSINTVKTNLAKNKYKDAAHVYDDLHLVFLNALFYNEEESQIAHDAATLRALLDKEWRARTTLPTPADGLPATSAQAHHGVPLPTLPKPAATPATNTAAPTPPVAGPSTIKRAEASTYSAKMDPERASSPDMDVDVGGTPEPDAGPMEAALDGESDAIVQQLERSLPRWTGFEEVGWADVAEERYLAVVQGVSGHLDASGERFASVLDTLPEETNIPEVPYREPLSLQIIEKRVQDKEYASPADFDKDIAKLFLKGRRSYPPGSEAYGKVLLLQRLYQALVSPEPPSGPPFVSTTHFAALPAGPGTARPLHSSSDTEGMPNITSYRIPIKDRKFVDSVEYKGWTVKMADWLHLANCDDPARPIVGQVFRCWLSEEPTKRSRPGVTVAWYFRPEQTFHPAHRQFWENEVFKTSHFAEHPLEDIIEKIACQFTARHIRGRPRPPYWHPGWPLYVCDSRYNDRERIFVKIKNWNSCVPEEVRKSAEFMPIYPFERFVYPKRHASPFIAGEPIKAPGGIGDVIERTEGEKHEGGGIGRKRTRKPPAGPGSAPTRNELTDRLGQSRGLFVGPPVAGGGGITSIPPNAAPAMRYDALAPMPPRSDVDRSIITAAGGASNLGGQVVVDRLPPETARHFDRDPDTNEVLWFAAPPVDIPRPKGPEYSLAYLSYLAKKRKNKDHADAMDIEGDVDGVISSKKQKPHRTVTEQINSFLT